MDDYPFNFPKHSCSAEVNIKLKISDVSLVKSCSVPNLPDQILLHLVL